MSDGGATVQLDTVSDPARERVVVVVRGEVDAHTAPQLRAVLLASLDEGMRHVEIDASGLDFVDSTGVGVFVEVLKRLRGVDGALVIRSASTELRRLLTITDLLGHIDLVDP